MKQLIPKIAKLVYSRDIYMERPLPLKGTVNVKVGESVDPITKIGMTKISNAVSHIPANLSFAKGKFESGFVYTGEKIGRSGLKKVIAPFDGYISKVDQRYVLTQEPKEYWVLSGVWGEVVKKVENISVLIKTQCIDIKLTVCSHKYISGELIVFPNPSNLLQMQYLENFAKDVYGKVIYLGEFAPYDALVRAADLGVGAIIAGGADKVTFEYAKSKNIILGLINGFGNLETPDYIFDIIKEVSSRYVFVLGQSNTLRIPVPSNDKETSVSSELVELVEGLRVQVFQKPFYGMTGTISSVQGSNVYVNLSGANEPIQFLLPNILAVD
jgi:hypothetical protein